jgi:hypothetical protein
MKQVENFQVLESMTLNLVPSEGSKNPKVSVNCLICKLKKIRHSKLFFPCLTLCNINLGKSI